MKRFCIVAFTALVALSHRVDAQEKWIEIINQRDAFPIFFIYITPAGQGSWGGDQLGGKVLGAGQSRTWTIPWDGCYVDVMAKTFTGLTADRRNVNVCGGFEWTLTDEKPEPQPQPSQAPTPNYGGTMTWRITDKCANKESIRFRFFTDDRSVGWPGGTNFWYTKQFGQPYDQKLLCPAGKKICYGAWQPEHNFTWGAGADGTSSCDSCCYICDGKVHLMTLTCG
jgi:hypothetical protein